MKHDAIVVGAGHNGLIAACYLALAGRQVLVLEALDRPGGGSRTEETVPGHLFDLHSVAHNMINMTSIPGELDLGGAGLVYQEMDPFSVAIHADGRRVRFHRSVDETVASIAEHSDDDARAYEQFMTTAMPIVQAVLPGVTGEGSWQRLPRRMATVAGILRRGRFDVVRDVLGPYDSLLRRHLATELTRGPVAAFAAHAGVGPSLPGGALFAFWQAAYHLFGQWHARGGAQGLTDALLVRLGDLGVEVRCSSPVERIEAPGGAVRAVVTEDGDRLPTTAVVTTVNPRDVLLGLLDPPLGGRDAANIAAVRRGNVVQALVHVATDRLPPYPDARPDDWNGLQSYVDEVEVLRRAWIESEAGLMPDVLALYAFTTSALDPTLAPPGHHTVYLACPAAPSRGARRLGVVPGPLRRANPRHRRGTGAGVPVVGRRRPCLDARPHGGGGPLARSTSPCTSTSPSTSSGSSGRRRTWPVTGHLLPASTSPVPAPPRRAASPARQADWQRVRSSPTRTGVGAEPPARRPNDEASTVIR